MNEADDNLILRTGAAEMCVRALIRARARNNRVGDACTPRLLFYQQPFNPRNLSVPLVPFNGTQVDNEIRCSSDSICLCNLLLSIGVSDFRIVPPSAV